MATSDKTKHTVVVSEDGINIDEGGGAMPVQIYTLRAVSTFGPRMRSGPSGDIDAKAPDFFDSPDVAEKLRGLGEYNDDRERSVEVNLLAGGRIALRTSTNEVGDFKQRNQSTPGDPATVTLDVETVIEISAPLPFTPNIT